MKIDVYSLDDRKRRVYYTYVLPLKSGGYYIGSTANLLKRYREHDTTGGARKTRANPPTENIYYESFLNRKQAERRENQLKKQSSKSLRDLFSNNKRKATQMVKRKKKKAPAKRRTAKKRTMKRRRNPVAIRRRKATRKRTGRKVARRRVYKPTRRRRYTMRRRRNAPYKSRRRNAPYKNRRRAMSYRRRRMTRRRNPGLPKMFRFLNQRFLIQSASVAGGLGAGYIAMPLWVRMLPAPMTANYRRFYGALNLLLGGLVATMSKRKAGRTIGMTLAGTGVYDLIAKLFPASGLPALPNSSALIEGFIPETETPEEVSANYYPGLMGNPYSTGIQAADSGSMGANYEPALMGANYEPALFGCGGSPDSGL